MNLKRWSHVVAVADQRSFVRAADAVHLSQPALTRSIQAAEAELGLRLFDRGPLEVVPTAAGVFVVERARRLLFDGRCLERDVALYADGQLGDTAFGAGPYPAATFLPSMLASVRRDFPDVGVRVEIANWQRLLQRLRSEDIEFFVADTRDLPDDPGLSVQPLRGEPGGFYVRAAHPLPPRRPVALATLWSHGVLSVRLPQDVRAALAEALGGRPSAGPPLALECDDMAVLKTVALACDSVLAAPHAAVEHEVASGALRPLSVSGLPRLATRMGVVSLLGRTPSPMAARLIGRLPGASTSTPKRGVSASARSARGPRRAP